MTVAIEVDVGHRPDRRIAVAVVDAPAGGVTVFVDVEGILASLVLRKVRERFTSEASSRSEMTMRIEGTCVVAVRFISSACSFRPL